MSDISGTVRPTNFKLSTQIDHDDPRHSQVPCPPRWNPKVTRSRDQSDACRSITRERKAVETPKLVGRFPTTSAILRTSFKVKRSKIRVTDGVILTHKMPDIFRMVRPTKFKLRTQVEHKAPPHQPPPWPPRSKVKVTRLHDLSDPCGP